MGYPTVKPLYLNIFSDYAESWLVFKIVSMFLDEVMREDDAVDSDRWKQMIRCGDSWEGEAKILLRQFLVIQQILLYC